MTKPWRVVIVGGGFGGLRAAPNLRSDLAGSSPAAPTTKSP